jgi:hypothetical protein
MGTVEQRNGIWRLSLEQIVPFVKPERRDSAVYSTTRVAAPSHHRITLLWGGRR